MDAASAALASYFGLYTTIFFYSQRDKKIKNEILGNV